MSHPLRAALLALLLASAAGASAAHDGAFDVSAVRGTAFTDALVPPADALPAHAAAAQDACTDAPCDTASEAATAALTLAAADVRGAATVAPSTAPVRTGVDGKPAGIGSVPEPQTYALLCSGLCLIGLGARTSRRRPQSE